MYSGVYTFVCVCVCARARARANDFGVYMHKGTHTHKPCKIQVYCRCSPANPRSRILP